VCGAWRSLFLRYGEPHAAQGDSATRRRAGGWATVDRKLVSRPIEFILHKIGSDLAGQQTRRVFTHPFARNRARPGRRVLVLTLSEHARRNRRSTRNRRFAPIIREPRIRSRRNARRSIQHHKLRRSWMTTVHNLREDESDIIRTLSRRDVRFRACNARRLEPPIEGVHGTISQEHLQVRLMIE